MEPFVTNVFETVQGAPVTEFVEQLSTCSAAAGGDIVTDLEVAMFEVLHISEITEGTVCNKKKYPYRSLNV